MTMNNPSASYSFRSVIEPDTPIGAAFASNTFYRILTGATDLPLVTEYKSKDFCKMTFAKGELTIMRDQKKAELEREQKNLDQEILEKQQTLKLLKEEIKEISREYQSISSSGLAAGLAHEIRNPLTTIKGFIQLLKPDLQSAGKQELADVALEEINRANRLLTEFLSVLKPNQDVKRRLSINHLAKDMKNLFTSEAILKGIDFSVELAEVELFIMAEENSLKQVLVNFLKNAMEAVEGTGKNDGAIKMVVAKDGNFASISVIDNGSGIDEGCLEKIFTPFYTTKAEGTGIGLAISKQIIENHGGVVCVNSEPSITTFKISFPLQS